MREPFAGGGNGGQVVPPTPPPEPISIEPTTGSTVVPPSPSGFYRVFTPVEDYMGVRMGKLFNEGEAVVHEHETLTRVLPGKGPVAVRLVDEFAVDFGYTVESIPVGIPPIPRSQLRAAGLSPAVANS